MSTAALSPVSAASAALSDTDSMTRASAGIVVAFLDDDHVAGHEVGRGHRHGLAAAHRERPRGGERLELLGRRLGALLLHEPEDRVRDHDREDRERLVGHVAVAFERVHDERNDAGREEQQHERARELADEAPPARHRRASDELVGSVLDQAVLRFASGKPGGGIDRQRGRYLVRRERVSVIAEDGRAGSHAATLAGGRAADVDGRHGSRRGRLAGPGNVGAWNRPGVRLPT